LHWFSGSLPAGTVEQVPAVPVSAQDMHVAVQAVWQQTPWAQIPLAQSGPAAHDAPSGSFPQLPVVQTFPPEQSVLVVQVVRQLVAPQAYGVQLWLAPGAQLPTPSQRAPSVTVEPLQVWLPHALPAAYSRHAPAPLQEPSVPQLG
jgi:hypothetical protein